MSQILPFHGTLYDTTVVGDIQHVVAPPYDIIDAAGQQALHERNPHNIIRLELGLDRSGDNPSDNRYTRAAATLRDWIKTGALTRAFAHTVDGQMQTFAAKDGRFNRDNFFGQNEALARLAQGMTDEQIDQLKRGGHDLVKIYAAYAAAASHRGQPTVILAHTKKGYGMGASGQGKMTTHSQKKLDEEDLIAFRNRFNLPISDQQARELSFYKPADDSAELRQERFRLDLATALCADPPPARCIVPGGRSRAVAGTCCRLNCCRAFLSKNTFTTSRTILNSIASR